MRLTAATRYLIGATCLATIALLGVAGSTVSAADPVDNVFQNGEAGFIVSYIAYALGKDANETGACPDGMTQGYGKGSGFNEIGNAFVNRPDLQRQEGEVE